jgi:hypothetical protein
MENTMDRLEVTIKKRNGELVARMLFEEEDGSIRYTSLEQPIDYDELSEMVGAHEGVFNIRDQVSFSIDICCCVELSMNGDYINFYFRGSDDYDADRPTHIDSAPVEDVTAYFEYIQEGLRAWCEEVGFVYLDNTNTFKKVEVPSLFGKPKKRGVWK